VFLNEFRVNSRQCVHIIKRQLGTLNDGNFARRAADDEEREAEEVEESELVWPESIFLFIIIEWVCSTTIIIFHIKLITQTHALVGGCFISCLALVEEAKFPRSAVLYIKYTRWAIFENAFSAL